MRHSFDKSNLNRSDSQRLLVYVADLELEVDRLRNQGEFIRRGARETLEKIGLLCTNATRAGNTLPLLAEIGQAADEFGAVLSDLREPPGYDSGLDQVVEIAVRPLIEHAFRQQQRLLAAPQVILRMELESEYIDWFPARLRHILDHLLCNALKYRDLDKREPWVCLGLQTSTKSYQLRVSDNGLGLPADEMADVLEAFYRAASVRAAGLGTGLAVVKLLVEQSGGTLTLDSGEGRGTTLVAVLPRYDVDDFLI